MSNPDPNNFDNMSLPEEDNGGWDDQPPHDEEGDEDHGGHNNAPQSAAPAKRSLNLKKIGLLVGGIAVAGAGLTFGPDMYQSYFGAPEQVKTDPSPHHIKLSPRQTAQSTPAIPAAQPINQEQPTSPPLALPEAPKPATQLAGSMQPDTGPVGLDKPVSLALPDSPATATQVQGQAAPTPQIAAAAAPVALTAPAAPMAHAEAQDSSSLTDVLNALHDNGKTVSESVDRAATQISEHIDSKSDEVMSRLTQMQNTITELTSKTEALSKNIEAVETHGLQKPSVAGEVKKQVAQHVVKPHKIHHYRITSSPAAVAEPANGNLTGYHLRGFAKNMVLIQGPSGLMSVPIGSPAMQNGKPVTAIGTVQGLIRDGDKYVAKTTTGSIVQE